VSRSTIRTEDRSRILLRFSLSTDDFGCYIPRSLADSGRLTLRFCTSRLMMRAKHGQLLASNVTLISADGEDML